MLFLVDGFNVTMADPVTRRLPRDKQTEALVARLAVRGSELLGRGPIVVFFDGDPGPGRAEEVRGSVEVRYSRRGIADDAIVAAARASQDQVTVISSDRELKDRVRAAAPGAVLKCASALFEEEYRPKRRRGVVRDVGLPKGANKITEELKKLWDVKDED